MPEKVIFPNLVKARRQRGYTQSDLTGLLEYRSVSRYAQYETGDRKPNVIEAMRIAKVLGETVECLFSTEVMQKADVEHENG